ncbi:response regulator transcription factor [Clostridium hydrogenum]|uniref:response regulator transcription factor n=1 Tax=Clostridium hydrogenum TaxID=2855764 RepID=UPI001F2EA5A9|nr:response regulator transcription factor [Clostridium hydrogenum]
MDSKNGIKVLVVEDDREISNLACKVLLNEGFDIVTAYDGKSAMDNFQRYKDNFKLIVLDLMVPFIDGFEIIRRIRQKSTVPILVISAKSKEVDKVSAISMGADDYIVKPFSLNEFVVRVKALIRRYLYFSGEEMPSESAVNYKELSVNMQDYSVIKRGESIKITPIEFEILKLFLLNPKKVFTKAQIYDSIWGRDPIRNDNTIMVHIKRLRDKIEDDVNKPQYIETVWGIGYKLGE